MADLIPIDYDPFVPPKADQGVLPEPGETTTAAATPPPKKPEPEKKPEEKGPDYTIPEPPKLPTVEYAGARKKEEPTGLIPVDYDPFAPPDTAPKKGSLWKEAPKAVIAGAVETTASGMRGLAGQRQGDMYQRKLDEARAKAMESVGYKGVLAHRGILNPADLESMPDDQKKKLLDALKAANDSVEPPDLTQDPFYQAGVATDNWSKENLKAAHDYENSWTRNIGTGLGSTIPFLAAGLTGPLGLEVGLEMSAASGIGSVIDDAVQKGATKEQIAKAMGYGALPGMTDQLAVEGLLAKIPMPAVGKFLTVLGKVAAKAAIEGGQEGVQQAMQNVIAKYEYNPKQDLMEGVLSSAGYGAIVGGMVAGAEPHTWQREHPAAEGEGGEAPGFVKVIGPNGQPEWRYRGGEAATQPGPQPGPQPEAPKADDQPDAASPVQPEGTPASTANMPPTSTPGGTGAGPAPQPAGTAEQQAAAAPAPAPNKVETVNPGQPPSDIGAAINGAPVGQPQRPGAAPVTEAAPGAQSGGPEFNLREELPETTEEPEYSAAEKEQQARLASMFAGEELPTTTAADVEAAKTKRREKKAGQTVVAPANDVVSAALNATVAPPAQQAETLGTGRALNAGQPAAAPAANIPAAAATTGPPPAVQPAAAAAGIGPQPTVSAAPNPAAAPAQPQQAAQPEPRLSTREEMDAAWQQGQANAEAARQAQETAAFNVEPAAAPAATVTQEPAVTVGAPQAVEPAVALAAAKAKAVSKGRAKKAVAAPTVAPAAAEAVTPAKPKIEPVAATKAKETAKERKARLQEEAEARSEAERQALKEAAGRAAPQPTAKPEEKVSPPPVVVKKKKPTKAEAAIAKSKAKEEAKKPVISKEAVYVSKEEIAREEAEKKARLEKEQAERKAAEAARTPLARDIHRQAQDEVRRATREVSEGDIQTLVGEESDKAAAEISKEERAKAAENPEYIPLSPAERIAKGKEQVVERVKERLAEKEKAELEAFKSQEDIDREKAATDAFEKEKKLQAQQKLREQQAAAKKGQQKERAGKLKGLSAEGRRVQSHDSLMKEYAKEVKKKPEDRNPLVIAYGLEHQKQARLKKNPTSAAEKAEVAEKRAGHEAEKARIQQQLVEQAQAEEERAASEELSKEHAVTRDKVQASLDRVESAEKTVAGKTAAEQDKALDDHLRAFKRAIAGIKLPGKVDRAYQSMQESLAIYAKKESADPYKFAMARMFMDQSLAGNKSAVDEFYSTVMNEHVQGARFNEETGAAENTAESKGRRETDVSKDLTRRQQETVSTTSAWQESEHLQPMNEDEQAMLRSGRAEVQERDANRKKREEAGAKPRRKITVQKVNGEMVEVTASTQKGSAVLRDVNQMLQGEQERRLQPGEAPVGFVAVIQNALVRHLTQLVGDIDVHFVSAEDMAKLWGKSGQPQGLYMNYTAADRAKGIKPMVFIDSRLRGEQELGIHGAYTHTVMHELTHAATSLALQMNLRNTRLIAHNLRVQLELQMPGWAKSKFNNALRDDAEFVAECFSNEEFQHYLSTQQVPSTIAQKIGTMLGKLPSWMDAVTSMVSNAIGMRWGVRGQTYMEHMLRLWPEMATSDITQTKMSKDEVAKGKASKALPVVHPVSDPQALLKEFDDIVQGVKTSASNYMIPEGRRFFRDTLKSGGSQIMQAQQLFGGAHNAMVRLIQAHLKRDTLRSDLRNSPGQGVDNAKIQNDVHNLYRTDRSNYNAMSKLLHLMSEFKLDATTGLLDPVNSHIFKTGTKDQQTRAMHAELSREWAALPQHVQDVGKDVIEHFRKASKIETVSIITHSVENAMDKYGAKLPAGMTVNDAVNWVMSGDAARSGTNMTQTDKDWHAALGKTARTLADVPMLRAPEGAYVPFMRRGKHFFSARERPFGTLDNPKNLPKGAVLDAVTDKEKIAPNRLLFKNEADFNAFADSYPTKIRGSTMYINPLTGQKTTADASIAHPTKPGVLVVPQRVFVATVQNHRVEMNDTYSQLVERAQQLRDDGHYVSDIGLTDKSLNQVVRDMAPAEITRLIRNLEQTTLGQTTVGQEAMANAVYDAYIRQQTSPGMLARGLKRRGTLGYDLDLVKSLRDYNRDLANSLANAQTAREMSKADAEVKKYIRDQQQTDPIGSGLTHQRQALYSEVAHRIRAYEGDSANNKISNAIRNIVSWKHLMSPHFSIMNIMQPAQTTVPVLQGRHGVANTIREMEAAYKMGGRTRTVLRGLKQTVSQAVNIRNQQVMNVDELWKQRMAAEPDGAELSEVADLVRSLGFGASSGIEAPHISRLDMSPSEIAIDAVSNIATALPEQIEGMNRYVTATAAYRLARKDGMSHEDAKLYAAVTVEQTQGGYGASNNPVFFQNPLLSPMLQFRKYSLSYGNLFYRNLAWMVGKDKKKRIQAAKTLAGLALSTVALAGVTGLPLMEPMRIALIVANMFQLTDADWDDAENGMQKWTSKMMEWITGSKTFAEAISEANMYGYTRLANIDTHNMFSNDSLFLFGQPRKVDDEGIAAWLGRAVFGAPGGAGLDMIKHLGQGDFVGAVPWPKVIQNFIDAKKMLFSGTVDPNTGKQYHKPFSAYEAGLKSLGLRAAEESRPFEAGGTATMNKAMKATNAARRNLMERWRNMGPGERSNFFRSNIREWNASHRNPDEKIQMQDLLRSKTSATQYDKRLKKFMQYEED